MVADSGKGGRHLGKVRPKAGDNLGTKVSKSRTDWPGPLPINYPVLSATLNGLQNGPQICIIPAVIIPTSGPKKRGPLLGQLFSWSQNNTQRQIIVIFISSSHLKKRAFSFIAAIVVPSFVLLQYKVKYKL